MINAKCYNKWILCTQIFCHLIHISTFLWQKKSDMAEFSHQTLNDILSSSSLHVSVCEGRHGWKEQDAPTDGTMPPFSKPHPLRQFFFSFSQDIYAVNNRVPQVASFCRPASTSIALFPSTKSQRDFSISFVFVFYRGHIKSHKLPL